MTVTVAEAQARLPDLLAQLPPGETLTLTHDGRPVADLVTRVPPAPPAARGPDVAMQRALEEIEALRPKTPSPIRDEYLREARAGAMYGDDQ